MDILIHFSRCFICGKEYDDKENQKSIFDKGMCLKCLNGNLK